jgi:hypothetical protein
MRQIMQLSETYQYDSSVSMSFPKMSQYNQLNGTYQYDTT